MDRIIVTNQYVYIIVYHDFTYSIFHAKAAKFFRKEL